MNSGDDIAAAMSSELPLLLLLGLPQCPLHACPDTLSGATRQLTFCVSCTAGKLPIGSKDAQDLAWDRTVTFLKKHI